jgi:hypothetical protein
MIKAQIHEATLDGIPLDDTGAIIEGNDALEVIEAMKLKSPFTTDMTEHEYIDYVLSKIMSEGESTKLNATEFLSKLAEKGFLSFLPDEPLETSCISETEERSTKPCADNAG